MSFTDKKNRVADVSVEQRKAAKIGLMGSISIIIGAMIGVGIFFKNQTVFANNGFNGIGVLVSWLLCFFIALTTAYSYGEIVTCKTKTANAGLAGWYERYLGWRVGRFIKITQPLFYFSAYVLIISVFAGEAITNCFYDGSQSKLHFVVVLAAGVGLVAIFSLGNMFAFEILKRFSNISTMAKFIPLAMVIFGGVIWGLMHGENNIFIDGNKTPSQDGIPGKPVGAFDFNGVLNSLPAIMFAFDSFLIIGNISNEVKKPEKNVPLSIVISMILVGLFYVLVTIGQIVTGSGNPYILFQLIAGDNEGAKTAFNKIISIFLLITVLGVTNSMAIGGIRSIGAAVDGEIAPFSKQLKKLDKINPLLPGVALMWSIIGFWLIIVGIPSLYWNTDIIFDGLSNVAVLFFFLFYGILALVSAINRFTKHVPEVNKQKGQVLVGSVSGLLCIAVMGYSLFYTFLVMPITKPDELFTAWGLFSTGEMTFTYKQAAIWFWVFAIILFALPFINDLIIKLTDKKYSHKLIWQK